MDALEAQDPRRLGRFALQGRLGADAFATTYLAASEAGRLVAVKALHESLAADPVARAHFLREIDVVRAVGGVFTVQVVDADPDAAQPWLVTRFIDGVSLRRRVTENTRSRRSRCSP